MVSHKRLFWVIAAVVIIIDQLLKYLLSNFTSLATRNTGAGFGILPGWNYLLALVSLIVAVVVIVYYKKIPQEKVPQILFALFLGGVVGNFIDRLFRGFVIDFIRYVYTHSYIFHDIVRDR